MIKPKIEIRLRRDKEEPTTSEKNERPAIDDGMIKDLMRHAALTVVSVMAVNTALGTTREILVNVTNPANR